MFRLFIAFFLCIACPAWAAGPKTLDYAVYGGGFHVVSAQLAMNETPGRYSATIRARTQNTLARFAPWSAIVRSEGWSTAQGWRPQIHDFTTRWRNDWKTYALRYDKSGRIVERVVTEQGRPDDRQPADPKLTAGAMDLPTGILNFLRHRSLKQGCEGSFPVYDGKRRFLVRLNNQRPEMVKKNRYSVFSGPAISCAVEIVQQGGEWSKTNKGWFKIQEDSRARGRLPRITMTELQGFGGWLVPVRMDLDSPYGSFVMHLTSAKASID